ncbi:hypothetical protein [Marvinbryantia formatexigens]|nr:hypothetical protein [Marvinbryantia formatexigens]
MDARSAGMVTELPEGEVISMKQHRFWAWAMVVCLVMLFYTGKKHK